MLFQLVMLYRTRREDKSVMCMDLEGGGLFEMLSQHTPEGTQENVENRKVCLWSTSPERCCYANIQRSSLFVCSATVEKQWREDAGVDCMLHVSVMIEDKTYAWYSCDTTRLLTPSKSTEAKFNF
jgi:hypothetical protein